MSGQQIVQNNAELMRGTFTSAMKMLNKGGTIAITEGGFPFRPKTTGREGVLEGLDLNALAKAAGFSRIAHDRMLPAMVERTGGGEAVPMGNAVRHTFKRTRSLTDLDKGHVEDAADAARSFAATSKPHQAQTKKARIDGAEAGANNWNRFKGKQAKKRGGKGKKP